MHAIILAAGLGARLGDVTRRSTKCMVPLNGRRLIEYAFDGLTGAGVERVVMVVGHGAHEVQTFLGASWRGTPVEYVVNPHYAGTNNIYSLYRARHWLEADDALVLEGDVVFEPALLLESVRHPAPNVAVVAPYESWMDGTVMLLGDDRRVTRILSRNELRAGDRACCYKTVNVYKLSARFSRECFVPHLVRHVEGGGVADYYEEVLKALVRGGSDDLVGLPVGDKLWYEIDDLDDLEIASIMFAEAGERLARLQARHGGYWRFPRLRDFCYLVNPYAPPDALVEEVAQNLPALTRQYPSGQDVQRRLAGRFLHVDAAALLVGNGASELIRAILAAIDGPIAVPIPTFDEYPHTLGGDRLVEIPARTADLRHTVADMLAICQEHAVSALVLANPNNPTGQFIPKDAVADLARALRPLGIRLIVDESFVDFVDGSAEQTLLDGALWAHPNLVVVRSLSKAFGVAGLRLGVLASSDAALLREVEAALPIWNVNAIAEYYLQLFPRHRAAHRAACTRLVDDRTHLFAGLAASGHLRPIESSGNFILCEVRGGRSGADLCRALLDPHWILVKDCSAKRGFGGAPYVRITVRARDDNEYLLACLRQVGRETG